MMANKAKTALLCAYTLARAGQYAEAEALILSHEELSKTPEAIDLLARIRMEEGDEAEARRLWQSVQAVYPEHHPSRVALKSIGKRPIRIKWSAVWAALIPVALLLGFLLASCITIKPQPRVTTIVWDDIPSQAKIDELALYKGTTKRVCIASDFFSTPSTLFSRELLTEAISQAMDLPPEAIFIGGAPETLSQTAISVELIQQ
jgi:hypothetical protein